MARPVLGRTRADVLEVLVEGRARFRDGERPILSASQICEDIGKGSGPVVNQLNALVDDGYVHVLKGRPKLFQATDEGRREYRRLEAESMGPLWGRAHERHVRRGAVSKVAHAAMDLVARLGSKRSDGLAPMWRLRDGRVVSVEETWSLVVKGEQSSVLVKIWEELPTMYKHVGDPEDRFRVELVVFHSAAEIKEA